MGCHSFALQAYSGIHLGIDNIECSPWSSCSSFLKGFLGPPLPFMKDGDLLATIRSMLHLRGFDTVKGF